MESNHHRRRPRPRRCPRNHSSCFSSRHSNPTHLCVSMMSGVGVRRTKLATRDWRESRSTLGYIHSYFILISTQSREGSDVLLYGSTDRIIIA